MTTEQLEARSQAIVEALNNGSKTLTALGLEYGISRERVSQIYYKSLGVTSRGSLKQSFHDKQRQKREKQLDEVRFTCAKCQHPVTRRESTRLVKYCKHCHGTLKRSQRDKIVTVTCTKCGKEFHPFRSSLKNQDRQIGRFCSLKCYRSHPVRVGRKTNEQ